jgi:hypothetical protein
MHALSLGMRLYLSWRLFAVVLEILRLWIVVIGYLNPSLEKASIRLFRYAASYPGGEAKQTAQPGPPILTA